MADWDRSSTSDNASVVSAESERKLLSSRKSTYCIVDPFPVVAQETTSEETSKLEFSEDEEMLIAKMFNLVGERWSLIAGRIPGRSADDIEKGDNLPEILHQPKDDAQTIGLKEESGHSTEKIKGQHQPHEQHTSVISQVGDSDNFTFK
ncbi:transcription repressor MYB5-like isoform X2 [Lycium barbarum]|uniref:transcription repressor MYB5-like isoform X2 n=1 Tax=Lycium barbarum TaxID=112863 RepID=UPI00293E2A9B|nr:transcription repressor MYB5-like isoform X2 [Lycium barbarum]